MESDDEKLARLKNKYGATIEHWLTKIKPDDKKRLEIAKTIQDIFCGRLKPSVKYKLDSMECFLKKIFPTADYIVLSDSEDENVNDPESLLVMIEEDNINDEIVKSLHQESIVDNSSFDASKTAKEVDVPKPNLMNENQLKPAKTTNVKTRRMSICVPSIAEYSLKTQKLPPSSAYAKRSEANKPAFYLNYKEAKQNAKVQYDPKEEAIKLKNIKEKIYCKQFLKMDDEKKELKVQEKKVINNISPTASSSQTKLEVVKPRPFMMRKRANSTKPEVVELTDSE